MTDHTLVLPGSGSFTQGSSKLWLYSGAARPAVPAVLMSTGAEAYVGQLALSPGNIVDMFVAPTRTAQDANVGPDFATAVERYGRATLAAGGQTLSWELSSDTTEPYRWIVPGADAFRAAIGNSGVAATLTIRDRSAQPRPAGIVLGAARPDVTLPSISSPRPAGLALGAGMPRAVAKARPRPASPSLGAGIPRAVAKARPNPAGVALGAGRPLSQLAAEPRPAGIALGARRPEPATVGDWLAVTLTAAELEFNTATTRTWTRAAGFLTLPQHWAPALSEADRRLTRFVLRSDGRMVMHFGPPGTRGQTLGARWRDAAAVRVTVADDTFETRGIGGGTDVTEPYGWFPTGLADWWAAHLSDAAAVPEVRLSVDGKDARPAELRAAGIALGAGAPRIDAKARPGPAGLQLGAGKPRTPAQARPGPARLEIGAGRPRGDYGARPRPARLDIGAARPRGDARPRARPAGIEIGAGQPRSDAKARPRPAGLDLGAARPQVLYRTAVPRAANFRLASGRPRGPFAGGVAPEAVPASAANARWRRAARALAPARALVWGLEITHPDVADPVRVVSDTRDHTAGGETWVSLRFGARLAADAPNAPPRAELWVDNVGAVVTDWVTAAGGGAGARARVVQLSADPADPAAASEIEWEQTLRVESMTIDRARVTARLGPPSARGRQAVTARHDPRRSPGLF